MAMSAEYRSKLAALTGNEIEWKSREWDEKKPQTNKHFMKGWSNLLYLEGTYFCYMYTTRNKRISV